MVPNTGKLIDLEAEYGAEAEAKAKEELRKLLAGDDDALVPVPPDEVERVQGMNRHERRRWAALRRAELRAAKRRKRR